MTKWAFELSEELRILCVRMTLLPPHRRPYYPSTERMAILQLKAARAWSQQQTADHFLVTSDTIASWLQRVDEQGPKALVQLPEPVNKFPALVRYLVQRLKVLCPNLGKQKIAQFLARAALHLGTTTVGRILKEPPHPKPAEKQASTQPTKKASQHAEKPPAPVVKRVVTAKRINHVWRTPEVPRRFQTGTNGGTMLIMFAV